MRRLSRTLRCNTERSAEGLAWGRGFHGEQAGHVWVVKVPGVLGKLANIRDRLELLQRDVLFFVEEVFLKSVSLVRLRRVPPPRHSWRKSAESQLRGSQGLRPVAQKTLSALPSLSYLFQLTGCATTAGR